MPRHKTSQNTLPSLDGLSPDVIANLESMNLLAEDRLRAILLEVVPVRTQRQISSLLQKQQANALTEKEQEKLEVLQKQADMVMLRKARAAVLLRFRGQPLPTLAELHRQTSLSETH